MQAGDAARTMARLNTGSGQAGLPEDDVAKYRTWVARERDIERDWWVVDASGQTLGRLASRIAPVLRGKHKPSFTPNADVGDYVIVINCEKVAVTGNKLDQKIYYRHSGYNGGLKSISLRNQLQRFPERVIESAVRGMLPKNALGRRVFKKLRVYAGGEHPHGSQNPQPLALQEI